MVLLMEYRILRQCPIFKTQYRFLTRLFLVIHLHTNDVIKCVLAPDDVKDINLLAAALHYINEQSFS